MRDLFYIRYKKYQINVHGDAEDDITPEKFTDFLVHSTLVRDAVDDGVVKPGFALRGTYHQLYRIDGRLVAVGVVDFLPSSLSSVYGLLIYIFL